MFIIYFIFCLIVIGFISKPSSSEDSSSGTDLSNISKEDEKHIDTTAWMSAKQKKLQHMAKFHEEYQ